MVDLLPLFVIYDFESGSLPRIPGRQGSHICPAPMDATPCLPYYPPFEMCSTRYRFLHHSNMVTLTAGRISALQHIFELSYLDSSFFGYAAEIASLDRFWKKL